MQLCRIILLQRFVLVLQLLQSTACSHIDRNYDLGWIAKHFTGVDYAQLWLHLKYAAGHNFVDGFEWSYNTRQFAFARNQPPTKKKATGADKSSLIVNPSRERHRTIFESTSALGFRIQAPQRSHEICTHCIACAVFILKRIHLLARLSVGWYSSASLTVGRSLASARVSLFGPPCPRGLLLAQKSCACLPLCSLPPMVRFDKTKNSIETTSNPARIPTQLS